MAGQDEELIPEDFSKLILDTLKIDRLTLEDKKFLEEFTHMYSLSLNETHIKSTANFPDVPNLQRLELNGNHLPGSELAALAKYPQLKTLKFAGNQVREY